MTERKRCCCNCRHNIRTGEIANIKCHCDVDGHYIGYIDCFLGWCRKWASDKKKWEKMNAKIIYEKVKVRFLQDLDISGKVDVNKGEIRDAEISDGYCYIDFGNKGIARVPLNDINGEFEILRN